MCFPRGAPTMLFCVVLASSLELRRYSKAEPYSLFLPDLIVVLTVPPPVRPNCASKVLVITLNSWIASMLGATCHVPVRLMGAPFNRNWLVPCTPPFMTYEPVVSQPRVPE